MTKTPSFNEQSQKFLNFHQKSFRAFETTSFIWTRKGNFHYKLKSTKDDKPFVDTTLSIMTLSILSFSLKTIGFKKLKKKTLSIIVPSSQINFMKALRISTLPIKNLSIMTLRY